MRVLSDLSGGVVGALLDDEARPRPEADPFADALRRYQREGEPIDLEGGWRSATEPAPVRAGETAASVLRLLARDLLAVVSANGEGEERTTDEEEAAPPANVRPITGGPAGSVPFLELGSDGAWHPATDASMPVGSPDALRHRAHVASMGSRYPVARPAGSHVVLPPPPPSALDASTPSPPREPPLRAERAAVPPERIVPPSENIVPPSENGHTHAANGDTHGGAATRDRGAPREARSASPEPRSPLPVQEESVIQAVSGGTEVVAGTFARFQQLAQFVKALREFPEVQSVTTRQFVRGTVHLRVRHSPLADLAESLLTLTDFSPRILSSGAGRLEVQVEPPDGPPTLES